MFLLRVDPCFLLSLPGVAVVVYFRLDGALHVAERQRPRQFFHPLPDRSGWPVGHCPAGSQLPLPVAHRRPGQRRGRLRQQRHDRNPTTCQLTSHAFLSLVGMWVLSVTGQHIPPLPIMDETSLKPHNGSETIFCSWLFLSYTLKTLHFLSIDCFL